MHLHKLSFKIPFAEPQPEVNGFIGLFHTWIQGKALGGHMLIDVADYQHVEQGPGVALISHEANISADQAAPAGLLYVRKQPFAGAESFSDAVRETLGATLRAAALASQAPGVAFDTARLEFRIHDRLFGANTAKTREDAEPLLLEVLERAYGARPELAGVADRRELFGLLAKFPAAAALDELLGRLQAAV